MYMLAQVIHCFFPIIALFLLIIGIKNNAIHYIISSLWLSIIALALHFQASGGQILGSYFNYTNATIYTLNLLVLFIALLRVIIHLRINHYLLRFFSSLFSASIVIGILLVLTNLWINALFIENRLKGTPVMQVALFNKPDYCGYRYVFYKVALDGSVHYLCPEHYGLIPSTGRLSVNPDFIASQHFSPKEKLLKGSYNSSVTVSPRAT
jgi:hypothetical protein